MRPGRQLRAARTSRSGRSAATAMPRQFGPTSRAPCARTSASSCSWRSAPSAPDLGEAGGDDAERAHAVPRAPPPPRRARARPGTQMTARSTGSGHLADRPVAAHAGDRLAAAVDRVGGAGEVRREDVAEQLAADRAAPRRRADDRDRRRREERPQRRGDGDVVALVDARAEALGRRDREAHLDLAAFERRATTSKPASRKTREHRACSRAAPRRRSARCRPRRARAASCSSRRVADAASLQLVGDGERDLGRRPDRAGARNSATRDDPLVAASSASAPTSAPRSSQSGSRNVLDERARRRGGVPWKRR